MATLLTRPANIGDSIEQLRHVTCGGQLKKEMFSHLLTGYRCTGCRQLWSYERLFAFTVAEFEQRFSVVIDLDKLPTVHLVEVERERKRFTTTDGGAS